MGRTGLGWLLLGVALAGASCEADSGPVTKQGECMRLGGAYCSRGKEVGCEVSADCLAMIREQCEAAIPDDTCRATTEDRQSVTHDIDSIIGTKDTCESLLSVEDYLGQTVAAMVARPCG